eukprot:3870874-Amphidinium_carterae.1
MLIVRQSIAYRRLVNVASSGKFEGLHTFCRGGGRLLHRRRLAKGACRRREGGAKLPVGQNPSRQSM